MDERTWTFLDKAEWGEGAWQHEPDKVQWTDEATGLPCLAVRHPSGGHWCGYVGIAEGHPLFEVSYGDCPQGHEDCWGHSPDSILDVHGGITFSDLCDEKSQPHGVCHIPEPGQPDHVWWFGFDTAHACDLSPAWAHLYTRENDVYRDLPYIQAECRRLADQLEEMAAKQPPMAPWLLEGKGE